MRVRVTYRLVHIENQLADAQEQYRQWTNSVLQMRTRSDWHRNKRQTIQIQIRVTSINMQ
jgi:hypothetical protein